jgi:hypothetical protein
VDPIEERLTLPFYLKMMGLNALNNADALWADLIRAGRGASLVEVQQLLAPDHWRPVVMGSWFSLRFEREQIGTNLERAMALCRGTLTAPPLSVAAAAVIGKDAVPMLVDYIQRDLDRQQGAATLVSAVVEELGAVAIVSPEDSDRTALASLLDLAHRLRLALTVL